MDLRMKVYFLNFGGSIVELGNKVNSVSPGTGHYARPATLYVIGMVLHNAPSKSTV